MGQLHVYICLKAQKRVRIRFFVSLSLYPYNAYDSMFTYLM